MSNEAKIAARLGAAVARARRERGLSQEALAARLDVSKNFVGLVERGQSLPSVPRLVDFAEALGLSLDQSLLSGSPLGQRASKADMLFESIAPEYHDLAESYLRSLVALRPSGARIATRKRR